MSQRKALTKVKAAGRLWGIRPEESRVFDELEELTYWHRDYGRVALRDAATFKVVKPRLLQLVRHGLRIIAVLSVC